MSNKRKVYRLYAHEIMEYRINGKNSEGNFFVAVTHDVSQSGACLYLMDEVHVGDRIALSYRSVSVRENAVVKWVEKIHDDLYIAGMMFA
ncbi:MAG: PilZ domain-containing protein [Nitrospirota bacterium]|nr:PilZ domain-containing protein [Nitrospirota bacterium]